MSDPKILFLDIETAPNIATVWSIWNQNIGINQLTESSYILCWAAKWRGKSGVMFDRVTGDKKSERSCVVKSVWKLLDEADVVIHYNGKRFDIPTLNREFLLLGLKPPTPYKQIDLYIEIKKKFSFVSHKLAYIAKKLGFPGKIKTDHQLWLDCMKGNKKAWAYMRRYNMRDVSELEKIYERVLGWIDEHPNMGFYCDGKVCPNCKSKELVRQGTHRTKTRTYQRYSCRKCGSWCRNILSEKDSVKPKVVRIAE